MLGCEKLKERENYSLTPVLIDKRDAKIFTDSCLSQI